MFIDGLNCYDFNSWFTHDLVVHLIC